jgi:hypothetical protein
MPRLALGLWLALAAASVAAQPLPPPRPPAAPVAAPSPAGVSVPTWSQLSPDQRERLAPLAQRWDSLPASRRVQALERLERQARWESLSPEQQENLRKGVRNFRDLPPELRQRLRASMAVVRALPEDERNELQRQWRAMDPEQRRRWLETGGPGISPPPG